MGRRPDVILTVCKLPYFPDVMGVFFFSLFIPVIISTQGQDMTLIHMAPQVPHPDKLYQGRVHLVEVNSTFIDHIL